jgi:hypothetical protein
MGPLVWKIFKRRVGCAALEQSALDTYNPTYNILKQALNWTGS